MSPEGPISQGTRLGPYEIEAHIGAGGMGDVYRARDTRLDRLVALKTSREKYSERFEREMRAIAALSHPNVCSLYDVGPDYLVMELLEGQTLASILQSRRLSTNETVQITAQIADALDAAHAKGIVHRDIKPGNVFLSPKGHVKVLDFGLAKLAATASGGDAAPTVATDLSQAGTTMGTVAYMSPEQARGDGLDARSDLWSLGVVLYEMLAGSRPFGGTTHATTFDAILNRAPSPLAVDVELQRVVGKLLEKDRTLRYQSAADVVADLKRIVRSGTTGVPVPAAVRDKRRWVPIAAAVAALVLVGAGVWYWRAESAPPITSSDTIVIAEFVNRTGDPVFDGTLREALSTKLEQSSLVRPMSPGTVQKALEEMRLEPDTVVTPEIAREVCIRVGQKATLEGSIAALGTSYALNLNAINCQTGDVLAASQAQAGGKEEVLNALSAAVDEMRERLGEQLAGTERPDGTRGNIGLTTASLEAFQVYTRGLELFRRERRAEAYPLFQRAHEIDPDFAWAYASQAQTSRNAEERRALFTEAYERRQSASTVERLTIEFEYARNVEQDMEKARRLGEETLQVAPHTGPILNTLALLYRDLGNLRRATELHEQMLQDNPDFALSYGNLAGTYFRQGRLSEARDVLDRARAAGLESQDTSTLRVQIALAEGDPATVESALATLATLATLPAPLAPVIAANARVIYVGGRGRVREAEALLSSTGGVPPALIANLRPLFEDCRDTAAGDGAGLSLLLCGEDEQAADNAAARLADPQLSDLVRTSSEAVVALGRGNPQQAVTLLRARAELEFPDSQVSMLYAIALRRLDQPARAAEALRKITSNPANSNSFLFSRAQVELGRTLAAGDASGAKQAYEAFFERWKDADEDIPLLVNAKREYAALP